ncbi:hypothetical protein [Actinoallomurus liliacearum]|uniref:hypothetical protein n=1 Tax=Actinoallomurus liliacearum TaxID=1080073 RepID=UPI0031E709B6
MAGCAPATSADSIHLTADAVPATITVLDELPLTPLGKPDKRTLRTRATSTPQPSMTDPS